MSVGIGAQDLVVGLVAAGALGWLVSRSARRRRARKALGAAAPACDSCPGCQALGVGPEEQAAHLKAGAAGANPAATAHKRVIRITSVDKTLGH